MFSVSVTKPKDCVNFSAGSADMKMANFNAKNMNICFLKLE